MAVGCPTPRRRPGDVGLMHALKAALERNPRAGAKKRDGRSVEQDGIRFVLSGDGILACRAA